MAHISRANQCVTLVNVFRLHGPADQQRLVDVLVEATATTMRHLPGFVSASIHKSLDGTHVVNYAQWARLADWQAMPAHPAAQAHMRRALELAEVEGHMYQVVSSHEAADIAAAWSGAHAHDARS